MYLDGHLEFSWPVETYYFQDPINPQNGTLYWRLTFDGDFPGYIGEVGIVPTIQRECAVQMHYVDALEEIDVPDSLSCCNATQRQQGYVCYKNSDLENFKYNEPRCA